MKYLTSNAFNYMKSVAAHVVGDWPEGKLDVPEGETRATAWLIRTEHRDGDRAQDLARHLAHFGYQVAYHGPGWIRVSGRPTNPEAIREMEIRRAQERVEWLRTKARPEDLLQFATAL